MCHSNYAKIVHACYARMLHGSNVQFIHGSISQTVGMLGGLTQRGHHEQRRKSDNRLAAGQFVIVEVTSWMNAQRFLLA